VKALCDVMHSVIMQCVISIKKDLSYAMLGGCRISCKLQLNIIYDVMWLKCSSRVIILRITIVTWLLIGQLSRKYIYINDNMVHDILTTVWYLVNKQFNKTSYLRAKLQHFNHITSYIIFNWSLHEILHPPSVASRWKTLSHNVASSTHRYERGDGHCLHRQ
jgi:hypothetical protein